MKVLQVREYHREVASKKWETCDKTKCVLSMFYFMLQDNNGYATDLRKKGYIAFDGHRAVFGMTKQKAIDNYERKY